MTAAIEAPLFELPQKYLDLQAEARAAGGRLRGHRRPRRRGRPLRPRRPRPAAPRPAWPASSSPPQYGGRFEQVDSLAVTVVREALRLRERPPRLDVRHAGHRQLRALGRRLGRGPQASGCRRWPRWRPSRRSRLTEPDVGSDLRGVTTTVDRDGRRAGRQRPQVVHHQRRRRRLLLRPGRARATATRWSSSRPTPRASRSPSPHQIIAPHVLGDVVFDDVRVPLDHRLGEPGKGFKLMLATLATFRVSVAGAAVGLAQAALDEALATRHHPRAVRQAAGSSSGRCRRSSRCPGSRSRWRGR